MGKRKLGKQNSRDEEVTSSVSSLVGQSASQLVDSFIHEKRE